MLEVSRTARSRGAMLLALLALASSFVVACGSDDGDGSAQTGGASGASGDEPRALEAAYAAFVEDLYEGRWEEACAAYSEAYVERYPRQIKLAPTCVETMELEYGADSVTSGERPRVYEVVMRGSDRAIATIKVGDDDTGKGFPMKFVKVSGEWRLDGPAPWKDYGPGVTVHEPS